MNRKYFAYISSALLLLSTSCRHGGEAHSHGEPASEHGHEAGSEIHLEPEAAARFGVVVDTIKAAPFSTVVKVTGQIVDNPASATVVTAPTSGIVKFASGIETGRSIGSGAVVAIVSSEGMSGGDRNNLDRANFEAARRELYRLKPLYEEGIVSAKEYNAAMQAFEEATAQYSPQAAAGTARSAGAGVISQLLVSNGQYVEAGTPIATVSANRRLTLRADVPDRYSPMIPTIVAASISLPYTSEVLDLSDRNLTKVSASDQGARVNPGYVPLYFAFDNNGATLPGTVVDVYLKGAHRADVLTVPVGAIVEQQGLKFVYEQVHDDAFLKHPVKTGASDGQRVEILSGIDGGEAIVVEGATAVRLAESSGAVPEGHSHSH